MNGMNMNMVGANVNGINPAAMNAMANGTNGINSRNTLESDQEIIKTKLNTYIYDYFMKNEHWDLARALQKSQLPMQTTKIPPRRPNGADDGGDDSKDDIDKRPPDLPYPADMHQLTNENSFLLDWFQLFWEMFWAPRRDPKIKPGQSAMQYMDYTKNQNKLQRDQQQRFLQQNQNVMPGGMPQNYGGIMRPGQPGMNAVNGVARTMAGNNRMPLSQQQQQQLMLQQRMMQQQNMERAGSEVDMNGRPRTPSSGENAPSPSKRPRLEQNFPGQQMMPNGRFGPGMSGQPMMTNQMHAQALLRQNDIDPNTLSQSQFNQFSNQNPQVQKRTMDVYTQSMAQHHQRQNMSQAMNGQGPMLQPGMEGMEFYGGNMRGPQMNQNGGGQSSSNHALQDYQMQLMLLEQQNKKRLLMARQEQETIRPGEAPGMAGQPGFAPNMSPQGSRSGPSPNPSEQMKRGTPKMGPVSLPGGPNSPMPDGSMAHGRGSPGAMNFNNGMNMDMMQQMKGVDGMQMGPNGIRAPSSHPQFNGGPLSQQQMENPVRAQGGRMPNGANWQQGPQGQAPGMPQVNQAQNPQMTTPQQRNAAMPPPQNVPAPNNPTANGRPASPAQPAAASTPQQSNKPAPAKKGKADKETKRRPTKNKTVAAATPSAENENPPPTPTPATPSTPMHAQSFAKDGKIGNAQPQATTAQANTAVAAPVTQVPQPSQDNNMLSTFDTTTMDGIQDIGGHMPFSSMDTADVLEQFDFDAFLESGDGNDFMNAELVGGYENFAGLEGTNE